MTTNFFDRVQMSTATTGTGTMTLGSASAGYRSFATAGVADQSIVTYLITDTGNAWEIGTGLYTVSGTTLTRNARESTNSNAAITLSGSGVVSIIESSDDIVPAPAILPQGRLTLTTATPIMVSDVTATSSVYYTPYIGAYIPIFDGRRWKATPFSQLTMTLNSSNNLSGKIYDLFVFINSGAVTIASGPAWTSNTARSAAIARQDGIWTNSATITLTNGATSYSSLAANTCTYVGSVYCTANAQTGVALNPAATGGGTANVVGVYNAYNPVVLKATALDTNTSGGVATGWAPLNANVNNSVTYLDGLASVPAEASFSAAASVASNVAVYIGIGFNQSASQPGNCAIYFPNASTALTTESVIVEANFNPTLGLNVLYALCIETSALGGSTLVSQAGSPAKQVGWLIARLAV